MVSPRNRIRGAHNVSLARSVLFAHGWLRTEVGRAMRQCRPLGVMGRRFGQRGVLVASKLEGLPRRQTTPNEHQHEPGEWTHGWQHWASSISDTFFRKSSLLSSCAAASRATPAFHIPVAMREPPSPMLPRPRSARSRRSCSACCSWNDCNCLCLSQKRHVSHSALDARGRHIAACTPSGRVRKRASRIERVLARVCRNAGARVRFDACFRNMNVDVVASDGRHIEVLGQDLPCHGGAQLAVDITLRCVLTRAGEPHRNAADVDGAVLVNARRDKEAKYPEMVASRRCKLVVVGIETGGRWSEEAVDFVRQLSIAKAEEVPSFMRRSVSLSWERPWTRMLSVVCATAFATSLVEPARQCESICWTGGDTPPLADLLWQDPRGQVSALFCTQHSQPHLGEKNGVSSGCVARLVACGWRRFSIAFRDASLLGSFFSLVGRSGRRRALDHSG